MIHIIVAVLTVAPEAPEVFDPGKIVLYRVKLGICVKISGISLLYPYAGRIYHVGAVDNVYLHKLSDCKVDERLIRHTPQLVTLVAEIFKPYPHRVLGVCDHVGRPVVEELKPAYLHIPLLNVDPAVRHIPGQRPHLCFILQLQLVYQKPHGDEIAVRKPRGYAADVRGSRLAHPRDQILDRHGGHKVIPGEFPSVGGGHCADPAVLYTYPFDTRVHYYLAAAPTYLVGKRLPELSRSFFGVVVLLNKRCFHLVLRAEGLGEHVPHCLAEGKPLDALSAPVGGYLSRTATPQLGGVVLKEHLIKRSAEAVYIEVFKRVLFFLDNTASKIAEPRPHRVGKAHILKGLGLQRYRIVKELAQKEDARNAVSQKHHAVLGLGIGTALRKRLFHAESEVVN